MSELTLISQVIAILILLVVIIAAFFEIKGIIRDVVTILLLLLAIMNYYVIYVVSTKGVLISIYPLLVVEKYGGYGSIYLDFGQISLLVTLVLWRKEIFKYTRYITTSLNRAIHSIRTLRKNTQRQ